MKKIILFGTYNPDYPRNRLIKKVLNSQDHKIVAINYRGAGLIKYFKMMRDLFLKRGKYDHIFIGFPGHLAVIIARLISPKPIIFDAFISLHDTYVNDRQDVDKDSWKAKWYRWQDRFACLLADVVIVDTLQHGEYFHKYLKIPQKKIRVIPVAADPELFKPSKTESKDQDKYVVYWHGKYTKLHNVRLIVRAAAALAREKDIHFQLLGSGGVQSEIKQYVKDRGLSNVTFLDTVPYEELSDYINQADLCLGVFGDSEKVDRVVPNKLNEYLACGKLIITRDSKACRDMLSTGEIFYLDHNKPEELSSLIINVFKEKGRSYFSETNHDLSVDIAARFTESLLKLFNN